MKRLLGLALIVLLAVAALAWVNQRAIGQRLFDRAVDQRVQRDLVAELPDGLHAFVCGSGAPLADAERAGPCIAVLAGKHGFVFDSGSGSIRKLGAMQFPFDRLDAAFLTHLHSDHIDGLGELMLQAWIAGGRNTPLPIYGPPRTDEVVAGFTSAYAPDRGFRIAHHGPQVAKPGGFGADAKVIDIDALEAAGWDGMVFSENGVVIKALRVDHSPVDFAFAYRIEYGGRAVVISGDTSAVPDLAVFAKGADVIFHDALNPQMVGRMGAALKRHDQPRLAKIMTDIPDYHATPLEAAQIAERAGASTLVLYHMVPGPPVALMNEAFLGGARDAFSGDLELAKDGMIVSLPAGKSAIKFDQLL